MWENLLSLMGMLAVVVIVLGLTYLFTRFLAGGRLPQKYRASGSRLHLVEQLSLGKDLRLAVVELGKRYLVLGITPASITLVAELTETEWDDLRSADSMEAAVQPPSFQDALKHVLDQRFKK